MGVKKYLTVLVVLCSILLSGLTVMAEDVSKQSAAVNTDKADALKAIGLFSGTTNGYELERAPTRVEGAVMLLRLTGKEEEAKGSSYTCPFSDVPAWASKQIGYMYNRKLTAGVSANSFGADQKLTAPHFVTFVLRSLGYNDDDFSWQDSIDKAVEIGLLSKKEATAIKEKDTFLRDDVVAVSYSALKTSLKGKKTTLIEKLIFDDKTLDVEKAEQAGIYQRENNSNESPDTQPAPESASIVAAEGSCEIAKEYVSRNGLAYTLTNAVEVVDGQNCYLELLFHIRNAVHPKAPQEQNFKIYYTDGTSRYQSFPYEPVTSAWISRQITLDIYNGTRVAAIELGPDPSSKGPEKDTLKWDIRSAVEQTVTNGDSKPPVLESIDVLQASAGAGDNVTVKAAITDKVGVKSAEILFSDPRGQNSGGITTVISISLTQFPGTDTWQGSYTVHGTDTKGLWRLSCVNLEDNLYNSRQITVKDLPDVTFTIK